MENKDLEEKAAELGFRPHDVNKTLAEVVQSRDQRLWEAFPVMLASAAEAGEFNYEAAAAHLRENEQNNLKLLVFASLGLYESLGAKFKWTKVLFGDFPPRLVNHYREKLNSGQELLIGEVSVLPANLKENFLKRPRQAAKPVKRQAEAGEQLDLESLRAEARARGLEKICLFTGWRADSDGLLAASDLFALTSLWEGLPRSLVEALKTGLPSVCYATDGVTDILRDGENGFCVPQGNLDAFCAALSRLLADPALRARLAAGAAATDLAEFDIDYMVRQQEALYSQLIEKKETKQ